MEVATVSEGGAYAACFVLVGDEHELEGRVNLRARLLGHHRGPRRLRRLHLREQVLAGVLRDFPVGQRRRCLGHDGILLPIYREQRGNSQVRIDLDENNKFRDERPWVPVDGKEKLIRNCPRSTSTRKK